MADTKNDNPKSGVPWKKIFITLIVLCLMWGAFQVYILLLNLGYYKEEASLPPSHGYARFEIADYKLEIPVSYLYTFYEKRGNRWVEDMKTPQKVDGGITFNLFWPDLKPYNAEVHAHPDTIFKNMVLISISNEEHGYTPEQIMENSKDHVLEIKSSIQGLREFKDKNPNVQRTTFIRSSLEDPYFYMMCQDNSCSARTSYQSLLGLRISYSFSQMYLLKWIKLHDEIHNLISSFTVPNFKFDRE